MTVDFVIESDKIPVLGMVTRKLAIGLRELLALAIITVLVIICIILAAMLSQAKSSANGQSSQTFAQTGSGNQSESVGNQSVDKLCLDKLCLDSVSYVMSNMDKTVEPCDNFYQYACGKYISHHTVNVDQMSSQLSDIAKKNMQRIEKLLLYDNKYQWASERKAKDMYKSCVDDFTTEKLRGTPFINQVLPKFGGAYFLKTWDNSSFNLQDSMNKVQSDLGVNAFWLFKVQKDVTNDLKDRLIEIFPTGVSRHLNVLHYLGYRGKKPILDYKKFMRTVANLLIRDSGVKMDSSEKVERVNQFVNDTWSVETKIVRLAVTMSATVKPYENENRLTLKELNTLTNNKIDWLAMAKYMFSGYAVTANTKVVVHNKKYLQAMIMHMKGLLDSNNHRVLHNYLLWRAMETYVQDLSWEYVHANREIYVDIHGQPNFLGKKLYCYVRIITQMPDAIGALFVANHFADKNKDKVKDITKAIKDEVLQLLDKTSWMDGPTRIKARTKLMNTKYNIGYPELYKHQQNVDRLYQGLQVTKGDYFGNALSYVKYQRSLWTKELLNGENLDKWYYRTFDTALAAVFYLNQVVLPAGLLQFPIYDFRLPHYMTFGSMGTFIGRFLLHLVDEKGNHWSNKNLYLGIDKTWWTDQTTDNYAKVKKCFVNTYNETQTVNKLSDQTPFEKPINSTVYAFEGLATTSGVRASYAAYQMWTKTHKELSAPNNLNLSNKQMFFLAFAQTWCTNRGQKKLYNLIREATPTEEIKVNYALRDLKEFSDAFQCKPNSAMNPSKKCKLF
ncbi:endothelin-converting enzyme 1-like isoform X2 [Gigantopelta aegis]|uniref:endothelin-converting enzyme 1-like isoform X2 n=1 Tax=Gigantopelta aegis TaxID=1735272 RepID=UPI001B88C4DD|nr:endothelin-converting enzyme 1-like isoform X2 [Gigantopelta aegis]